MTYVEFAVTSNFSFLRGASHPEELVAAAQRLGMCGLGIADRNSVAGVVRAKSGTSVAPRCGCCNRTGHPRLANSHLTLPGIGNTLVNVFAPA